MKSLFNEPGRLYMPCALLGADAWFKKSLKRWKFLSGDIVTDIGLSSDSSGSLMITLESDTAAHRFGALLDKACKSVTGYRPDAWFNICDTQVSQMCVTPYVRMDLLVGGLGFRS